MDDILENILFWSMFSTEFKTLNYKIVFDVHMW